MLGNLNGWHLVIILFLVLLLFGAPKLPGLARSVGQSMKIFKSEIKNKDDGEESSSTGEPSARTEAQPSTESSQKTTPRTDAQTSSEKSSDDPNAQS